MNTEWLTMSAADLGRGIGDGSINVVDLTETFLTAIKAHPLRDRIYARLTEDRARSEASAAHKRAQAGQRLSPLDGVPVSWKDLFDTAGVVTEAGSALLAGRVPDRDALVLQTATAAGLVCLGKTHMSELAFSGLGYNPVTQSPPSVNDPDSVAGGSSSGAAASVAFGLAAAAVGSDTGGSVRIPSAWNDLVGLKTTSGRLSLQGVVPLAASFDTVGPLCRTVEDAALMLAALEGAEPSDLQGFSLKDSRFAILDTVAMDGVREGPAKGFADAVAKLRQAGAIIENIQVPVVAAAMSLTAPLYTVEAYATWKDTIEAAPHLMFGEICERFRAGGNFSGVEYVQAWQALERYRQEWNATISAFDAVIIPTSPILPPNMARLATDHEYYVAENLLALRNTRIGNLMNCAALTMPTGVPSAGISFLTHPGDEHRLLRIGVSAAAALA